MSETTPRGQEQLPANVTTLRRQLVEMAARTKASNSTADRRKGDQGPAAAIRGK